jgi:hypothetical protein
MKLRGRYLVLAWVGVFLIMAGVLTWRDRTAFNIEETLRHLRDSLEVATARHAQLQTSVAGLESAAAITSAGEALGLVTPTDSEMFTLTIPDR